MCRLSNDDTGNRPSKSKVGGDRAVVQTTTPKLFQTSSLRVSQSRCCESSMTLCQRVQRLEFTQPLRTVQLRSRFLPQRRLSGTTMESTATHVSHEAISGGICSDRYEIEVPLDHFGNDGAGEAVKVSYRVLDGKSSSQDKYLLFLQGGPGFGPPAPWTATSGWIKAALDKKYRVVLMDQRGTGLSTPISCRSLEAMGDAPAQVAYLKHFRADSIVQDAERIRESLGVRSWSTLGQSFGGFVSVTYLLTSPGSLEAVLLTGGVCIRAC